MWRKCEGTAVKPTSLRRRTSRGPRVTRALFLPDVFLRASIEPRINSAGVGRDEDRVREPEVGFVIPPALQIDRWAERKEADLPETAGDEEHVVATTVGQHAALERATQRVRIEGLHTEADDRRAGEAVGHVTADGEAC